MRDLQGQFALSWHSPYVNDSANDPNVPFADLSSVNATPVALAAFAVLRSGVAPSVLAYLQFYTNLGGAWKLQSELRSDFNDTYFSVARVDSGMPGELRYVVWCQVPGSPDGVGGVSVYSFDGVVVRTIWKEDGLLYPRISVSGNRITLEQEVGTFDRGFRDNSLRKRQTDVMRSTPSGLLLESSTLSEER
jgi:hypothetical protein